ncbi:MAG: hypothetical protein O3A37_04720 [Planctomycetota bacterium]|nr:hypothetical protein [Planctomycetota bacterium]
MSGLSHGRRFAGVAVAAAVVLAGWLPPPVAATDLATVAANPLGEGEAFRSPSAADMDAAAAKVRAAMTPLDSLLRRSKSGEAWKAYLDWPTLTEQAAAGSNADPATLLRIYRRLDAEENGLEMPEFAAVRRAVGGYLDAVDAATNPAAEKVLAQRLTKLTETLTEAATTGTTESLESLGPLLARLEGSRQAPATVARVRSAVSRPNLYLDVDENLLASAVNRIVDEHAPVNDTILGTRVRGMGHTTGFVLLDFVPSLNAAVVDLVLDATNHSSTRSSKGPVTVHTQGTTTLDARKRIMIDDQRVTSLPATASADVNTRTAGIGVKSKFAKNLIRKMASKKIAEIRPQAEAISRGRAEARARQQFEAQTSGALAQAASDYQTKFRRPLLERGWYPEMLHLTTSDSTMSVVARKALSDQIAAFTAPPAVDPDAILAARVHETMVNNAAEITLGGRTITQQFVEDQIKKNNGTLPESLANDPDQPPWSITFAKRLPVQLDADDDRVKVTVRGSRFTSGDREFPAMDIWAAYRIEPAAGTIRLVRDGDVQIYPPGFVPGGGEKLSVAETSLRRILQKRFNKVFKEVVDVEPLDLPGELKHAGPLPMEQLVARKDGWVAAGWRKKAPVVLVSEHGIPSTAAGEPTLAVAGP